MNTLNRLYLPNWWPPLEGNQALAFWRDVRHLVNHATAQGVSAAERRRIVSVTIFADPLHRARLAQHPVDVEALLRRLAGARLLIGYEEPQVVFAGVVMRSAEAANRGTLIAFEDIPQATSRRTVGYAESGRK